MSTLDIVSKCLPTLDEAIKRFNSVGDMDKDFLDSRDARRLAMFMPAERLAEVDMKVADGETHTPLEWNAENVAKQLAEDVDFAFTKALNQRGISASLMSNVMEMWQRILAPELQLPDYAQYGLPIIKTMAVHFELPNEIGDDVGNEDKYSSGSY